MKWLINAACLVASACIPQTPKASEPLAPARAGKLMCVLPVESEKRCSTLTALTFGPDGSVKHHSDVLMGDQPRIVIATDFPVTLKDGTFCGSLGPADVDAVMIKVDGALAEPERAAEIRDIMKANMAKLSVREGCLKPTMLDDDLVLASIFDGIPRPGLDKDNKMIWVKPNEGYSVR